MELSRPSTTGRSARIGPLFFPRALVNPVAYAPLARAVAQAGFPAYLGELPRRGAFGGANDKLPPTTRWVRIEGGNHCGDLAGTAFNLEITARRYSRRLSVNRC